jgi:hypothetical protein
VIPAGGEASFNDLPDSDIPGGCSRVIFEAALLPLNAQEGEMSIYHCAQV